MNDTCVCANPSKLRVEILNCYVGIVQKFFLSSRLVSVTTATTVSASNSIIILRVGVTVIVVVTFLTRGSVFPKRESGIIRIVTRRCINTSEWNGPQSAKLFHDISFRSEFVLVSLRLDD